MARTRIKICGVGRVEDAIAAARAGADAIGMVFHRPAARFVGEETAREIVAALPPFVTPVGLFVDTPADEVCEQAQRLGLRHIQLHGHEDPACVAALRGFAVLKAIRVDRRTFADELSIWREAIVGQGLTHFRGIVLETAGTAAGGTGVANDWAFVRECQAKGLFDGLPPIIAAGGLTPGNVGELVRTLRPWAVDVSSGVEVEKGVKAAEKLEAFVCAVKEADQAFLSC